MFVHGKLSNEKRCSAVGFESVHGRVVLGSRNTGDGKEYEQMWSFRCEPNIDGYVRHELHCTDPSLQQTCGINFERKARRRCNRKFATSGIKSNTGSLQAESRRCGLRLVLRYGDMRCKQRSEGLLDDPVAQHYDLIDDFSDIEEQTKFLRQSRRNPRRRPQQLLAKMIYRRINVKYKE